MPDKSHSAELAALTAIAALVNCTQELDEILAAALQTTVEVVGVDAGEIFIIDQDTGNLALSVRQGLSDVWATAEATVTPGECLCGLALELGRPVVVPDVAGHPRRSRLSCMRDGLQSAICLPLKGRGQVLGLLNVQTRMPRAFDAHDEELLIAIGNQIGVAIENARLIEDAERRRATLDSVMHSLVDGLILADRHRQITYSNPCAQIMLGLPVEELIGRRLGEIDLKLAERAAAGDPPLSPLLAGPLPSGDGEVLAVEFALVLPEPRTVQARLFPIRDAGGLLGEALLLRDITREKELDKMKSQLLSTVSHELRTPLASIKGFATTLLRQDVEWDEGSRREFLAIIDEESDRLAELISNLLDMARIEAGTLRVEREPIRLEPLIEETVGKFRLISQVHRFEVMLPAGLPWVLADARRIRQVLRNLIENAVKYSPNGGTIAVAVKFHSPSRTVQVSVADEGIGIAPEHQTRLFDRFYQVDSASTRKVGGTGLGLSICRAIIDAHQGQIWVLSQPGSGSVFYFTLPTLPQPDSLDLETSLEESDFEE